jgi:hypothetical protein
MTRCRHDLPADRQGLRSVAEPADLVGETSRAVRTSSLSGPYTLVPNSMAASAMSRVADAAVNSRLNDRIERPT